MRKIFTICQVVVALALPEACRKPTPISIDPVIINTPDLDLKTTMEGSGKFSESLILRGSLGLFVDEHDKHVGLKVRWSTSVESVENKVTYSGSDEKSLFDLGTLNLRGLQETNGVIIVRWNGTETKIRRDDRTANLGNGGRKIGDWNWASKTPETGHAYEGVQGTIPHPFGLKGDPLVSAISIIDAPPPKATINLKGQKVEILFEE